jgi:cell division protein FtsQ
MTPSYAMPMPLDVRLMTLVTSVLGWAFVAAVLMAGGMWAVRHPVWSIKAIEVHGDLKHQNEVTFRAHMASKLRGSFLTLDLDEVQQVFESVPWVRAAVVERAFPNRIRVTLQEHQAVAWWGKMVARVLSIARARCLKPVPKTMKPTCCPNWPGQMTKPHE